MAEKFYTILTAIGKSKLANSAVLGSKVNFKMLKVGDGSGTYYEPSENQTSLINKVWEGNISSISIDESNSNWIVIETIIPATDGGFFIREAGIFDEEGDLIAVSKISETYKPIISEGSTKDVSIKIVLEVSSVDTIILKIDPNVIVATKNDIQVLESKVQDINVQLSDMRQQSKTYAQLQAMVTANSLVPGTQYVVTDYATKYRQPDTEVIKTMSMERLILTATSTNTFDVICSSLDFPQDIIHYHFELNLCEDAITTRNGFITRRIDESPNVLIDCPLDWRTILWARWRPDANNYLIGTTSTPYSVWTSGAAVLNVIYKSGNALYMAINTSTPISATDSNIFQKIYEDITIGMLLNSNLKIGYTGSQYIYLVKGTLHERPTFGIGCSRISFGQTVHTGSGSSWYLINNVFGDNCGIVNIGTSCNANTFANSIARVVFGGDCYANSILLSGSNCISFGAYCYNNTFTGVSSHIDFENNCFGNISWGVSGGNHLSSDCFNNTFAGNCNSNSLSVNCNTNIFGINSSANTFASNCYSNTFGINCYHNNFGSNCRNNTFGSGCGYNDFATSCFSNVFGVNCYTNTFGAGCYSNTFVSNIYFCTFGGNCYSNNFADGSGYNTFGSNCYSNTFGAGCTSNTFSASCWGTIFGTTCNYNNLGSASYQNSFGNGCGSNNIGAYNCCNTFGDLKCNLLIKYMRSKNISAVTALNNIDHTNTIEKRADNVIVYWALSSTNVPTYTVIA